MRGSHASCHGSSRPGALCPWLPRWRNGRVKQLFLLIPVRKTAKLKTNSHGTAGKNATMFETYAAGILIGGIVLSLAALVWLAVRAFRVRRAWGFSCLFFPPALLPFALFHRRKAIGPLLLLAFGVITTGATLGVNRFIVANLSLGLREAIVDGEGHITLTGWDQDDYSVLKNRRTVVVLQMANADVTDETLEMLAGMANLRELDLNDTRITDAGLETLAQLPALAILRLRGTAVTDAGFTHSLKDKVSLLEIDARNTQIASRTLRDWKAENKDQRKFLK
ncbi:MAG: hypothetical protein DWH82_03450 [Planctomycetota bacterium]|nr:MAG: hypothetical protein DWH82_03450 [Planctomycetota bacterium]